MVTVNKSSKWQLWSFFFFKENDSGGRSRNFLSKETWSFVNFFIFFYVVLFDS